jgi:hypothetical protein
MATELAWLSIADSVDENNGAYVTRVFRQLGRELMNTAGCYFGFRSPDFFRNSPGNAIVAPERVAVSNNQNPVAPLAP